jgi:hypothetical protein
MAASRLRRTFQYPSESGDEDAVEHGMDEQGTFFLPPLPPLPHTHPYTATHSQSTLTRPTDQTALLQNLSTHDTSSTRLYTLLLSFLPLAVAIPHVLLLGSIHSFIPSLLAIASFGASAYALYFVPLPPVKVGIIHMSDVKDGGKGKNGGVGGYGFNTPAAQDTPRHERPPVPYIPSDVADMLASYIVPANAAVCVLFTILELWRARSWSEGVGVGGGYLPGVVLGVVVWARRELRVMDMSELERLKIGGAGTKDT